MSLHAEKELMDRAKAVVIHLNAERVEMTEHHPSGLAIKQAAIAQGVNIKADYLLFEEVGHEKTRAIADHERVDISSASRFLADVEVLTIEVNYRKIQIEGAKQTGLAIKEAAIAQGVKIKADFILYEIIGPGRTKQVGDMEEVHVSDCSKFDAVPDDDHS